MEWIILIFIVLFLIGRMERNSALHPANQFSGMVPNTNTPMTTGASSGDSFCSNVSTIATGIPQSPTLPVNPIVVPHSVFPIPVSPGVPPPFRIQTPVKSLTPSTTAPAPISVVNKPVLVPPRSTLNPLAPKPLGIGAGTGTRVGIAPRYRGY